MKSFDDFDAFYRYYLEAHSDVRNRRVHLLGWVIGVLVAAWGVITSRLWAAPLAVAVALAIALCGHHFIERNDSIVFRYPWWTTRADLRMFVDMARGRLARRAGSADRNRIVDD